MVILEILFLMTDFTSNLSSGQFTISAGNASGNIVLTAVDDDENEEEDDLDNNSVFVKPKVEKKKEVFKPIWIDNKFTRRGTIPDSPLCEKMTGVSKEVKLSFSDFKKMMKSD